MPHGAVVAVAAADNDDDDFKGKKQTVCDGNVMLIDQ